ncbi:MAG: hypothetical protein U0Q11_09780 [Vicinamibacterales bacterium]
MRHLRLVRHRSMPMVAACLMTLAAAAVHAAPDASNTPPPSTELNRKLTVSAYTFSSDDTGVDVNLRDTVGNHTFWGGAYHQSNGFDQLRAGYEYDLRRPRVTLIPSVQVASHGFVGATVYTEVGRRCFAIGGAGRTNLQPYWNLGFDPNDYLQAGAGCRDARGNAVSVAAIHDVRLHTGQTNTHVTVRRYVARDWRLTVDAVHEHGLGDAGVVLDGWAASADVDWRRWFARVAADPHVNYTADHQLRIAVGFRF